MFRPVARASWLQYRTTAVLLAGVSVAASAPYLASKVQNDVLTDPEVVRAKRASAERLIISDRELLERLAAYSWGSGSAASPASLSTAAAVEGPRTPTEAAAFSGVALRDLILHETQNALVDAAGDVYHWDSASNTVPKCVLMGKVSSIDCHRILSLKASNIVLEHKTYRCFSGQNICSVPHRQDLLAGHNLRPPCGHKVALLVQLPLGQRR